MGNYVEAKKILDQISITKTSDSSFETLVQNQRRKIQAQLNESVSNADMYSNSLNTLRSGKPVEQETQQSLSQTKEEIANVYRGQQRYDDEIDLRKQSIEFNLESNNIDEVAKDKVETSRTLEAKGESGAALKEMEEAARIVDTINNPKAKAEAFLSLAGLYEKNGRATQALSAYKKYSTSISELNKANESRFQMKEKLLNKQQEIEELTNDVSQGRQEYDLQAATVFRQQLIIYGLIGIILIIGIATYFIYRSAQASKLANLMLALKSLRSQMNPHFIFNALNSVNHFIAQQDERSANKFLSEFSQLMRLVLDNSQQDFITLNKEQEMLSLYIKLEHYRFRDKFDYEFHVSDEINGELVGLPPMLIQPYIENAVWHGLRYKESKGKLAVRFSKQENEIEVQIEDDGIGRQKSLELKTTNQKKHNSTGLKNIHERLSIINKVYHSNYRVAIEDLPDGGGTKVRIHLPVKNQMQL
jgi:tetratricopeptide (TPR) repeat protein